MEIGDFPNLFDSLFATTTIHLNDHNRFLARFFSSHRHLSNIDIVAGQSLRYMGNHTWNILVDDDNGWRIHAERD